MKYLIIIAIILSSTSLFAQRNQDKLTKVLREKCFYIPVIIPEEEMVEGIHYTRSSYETGCDYEGNNCDWRQYKVYKHQYLTIWNYEYWTADGKLVTTSQDKLKSELTTTRYEEIRKEITKLLYRSEEQTCANSPIQN